MNYKYGKWLQKEMIQFPHQLNVDPEGMIVLQCALEISAEHSSSYISFEDFSVTTADNNVQSYIEFIKNTLDKEYKRSFAGVMTEVITRNIQGADKDPEENTLVFNAQSGINFDTGSFMDFSFGVPVWGDIDTLNSIIAFDVNYKIGNKHVCLHIPVQINLTEERSVTVLSIKYNPVNNFGGCAAYTTKDIPTVSIISDYEEYKQVEADTVNYDYKKRAERDFNMKFGMKFKDKKRPVRTKPLFTRNCSIKISGIDEIYFLNVPEGYSYRLPLYGVLDEELSIV
jgi:hypothetical protein